MENSRKIKLCNRLVVTCRHTRLKIHSGLVQKEKKGILTIRLFLNCLKLGNICKNDNIDDLMLNIFKLLNRMHNEKGSKCNDVCMLCRLFVRSNQCNDKLLNDNDQLKFIKGLFIQSKGGNICNALKYLIDSDFVDDFIVYLISRCYETEIIMYTGELLQMNDSKDDKAIINSRYKTINMFGINNEFRSESSSMSISNELHIIRTLYIKDQDVIIYSCITDIDDWEKFKELNKICNNIEKQFKESKQGKNNKMDTMDDNKINIGIGLVSFIFLSIFFKFKLVFFSPMDLNIQ